ncbi:hypothetical protein [Niabella beijingensis]|uniref:hypothetical protein n=1 Tax=Niabella beijingensis TaxID=2872700 RepID=UPI001CBC429F|nr:hypothetical protein [Niabella beijingensis]MBZ4191196.1 hypothetical protein [Niabella beijingensis]
MEQTTRPEEQKSFYRKLRESILPVKPADNTLIKLGKNAGFIVFFALLLIVSAAMLIAVAFAL